MKKLLLVLLVAVLSVSTVFGCGNPDDPNDDTPTTPDWADDNKLTILGIGNSFTVDTFEFAYQIAKNLGIEEVHLEVLGIGGAPIDLHYTNVSNDLKAYAHFVNTDGTWVENPLTKPVAIIQSREWDYITLQQASYLAGNPNSYSNLEPLVNTVRTHAPNSKILFNMTWAYQSDYSVDTNFEYYDSDQMTMYNAIISTVKAKVLPIEGIDSVFPTGTAIQNARTSYLGDTLTRDGYHLSYFVGRYIAGLTLIGHATGLSLSSLTYAPDGVGNNKLLCIEAATNALVDPYVITPSSFV